MAQTVRTPHPVDERVIERGLLRRLVAQPELGAVAGAAVVWLFFAVVAGDRGFLSLRGTATYLEVAAELGILAVAVALLMIGGEFDLSVGSIIGASGMLLTILAVQYGWNVWAALLAVLVFAVATGLFNGYLVIRTGLRDGERRSWWQDQQSKWARSRTRSSSFVASRPVRASRSSRR